MSAAGEEVVRSMYAGFAALASGADIGEYVRAHFDPAMIELRDGRILRTCDYLERDSAVAAARRE
jgi:hypothetical protein